MAKSVIFNMAAAAILNLLPMSIFTARQHSCKRCTSYRKSVCLTVCPSPVSYTHLTLPTILRV